MASLTPERGIGARPMKVIVTGSTGFVGGHLCARLLDQGHDVIGVARSRHSHSLLAKGLTESPALATALFSPEHGGYALDEELGDVDVIFHLAGDPTYGNGTHYVAANVEPTRRLAELAATSCDKLTAFVFASSLAAQDRDPALDRTAPITEAAAAAPETDYGRSKLAAEELLAGTGLPVRIARLGMVAGADMRTNSHLAVVVDLALRSTRGLLRHMSGSLALVHVDDACAALERLAQSSDADGSPYLIVSENVPIGAVVDAVNEVSDPDLLSPRLSARLEPVHRALPQVLRSAALPELRIDASRMRSLGWDPQIGWKTIVDDVADRRRMQRDPDRVVDGLTIVTGAGSGLGCAMARRLAPHRKDLLLIDRDESALVTIATELGCAHIVADVSDPEFPRRLIAESASRHKAIAELFPLCRSGS